MPGLLGDIYSFGNGLKRSIRGLLADPANELDYRAQNMADRIGGTEYDRRARLDKLSGNVMYDQQAAARQEQLLHDNAMEAALAGITVWHGSPHKFDKFDSSKIGTGEGAQAYGHGLYVAESDDVAKQYANIGVGHGSALGKALRESNFNKDKARELLIKERDAIRSEPPEIQAIFGNGSEYDAAINKLDEVANLYKIDLADDALPKMLDWDKPLSEQSQHVRDAINKTKSSLPPNAYDDLGGDLSLLYGDNVMPEAFLNTMMSIGGRADFGEEALKSLGVPGIRYLDGASRGAGNGSYNYVIFPGNEGLLQIMERNGQPVGLLK